MCFLLTLIFTQYKYICERNTIHLHPCALKLKVLKYISFSIYFHNYNSFIYKI